MPEVSDIDLMELADGTIDEARRRMLEAELAKRPELRHRLEAFIATGKALQRLFDPVMEAPVPPGLVAAIEEPERPAPRVLHFGAARPPARERTWHWISRSTFSMAMAAGVAAAVAIAAALYALQPAGDGELAATQLAAVPLALALEKTPSDRRTSLTLDARGSGELRIESTFQHVDGRYCRQYELLLEGRRGFFGYACRVGNGHWRIEKELPSALARNMQAPAEGSADAKVLRPAVEERLADPSLKAIDAAIEAVARGDNVLLEREQSLIRSGWRSEQN